ncbi:MAG: DUF1579 domain-containing protein [Chitinophagaceae bacterium]|nr:DUF1579 domain-containing protein [Chitinophagaceae bacterium]
MKKITLTFCSAVFLMAACNNNGETKNASADSALQTTIKDGKKDTAVAMPDMEAITKAWTEFMTPGPMHKWMQKTNGTWEAEINQWMDPSAPPTKSKATIAQSSILGGRFVESKFSGSSMGQAMNGISTMGYDNAKKLFVATWIDNMSTGIAYMTGTYDSTTRTLNLKGLQTDPVTGKDSNIREEMTIIDSDSYSMVLFGDGMDGKEMKMMEGIYRRKK